LAFVNAIAVDDTIDTSTISLPREIDVLDLNNTEQIIEWINKNSKEMEDT